MGCLQQFCNDRTVGALFSSNMDERVVLILIPRIVILGEIRRTVRAFSRPIKAREMPHTRGMKKIKKKKKKKTKENRGKPDSQKRQSIKKTRIREPKSIKEGKPKSEEQTLAFLQNSGNKRLTPSKLLFPFIFAILISLLLLQTCMNKFMHACCYGQLGYRVGPITRLGKMDQAQPVRLG
jgi:hypothetical protein